MASSASSVSLSNPKPQNGAFVEGGVGSHETVDSPSNMNVLQKRVTFFDRNKNGVIYQWERFPGNWLWRALIHHQRSFHQYGSQSKNSSLVGRWPGRKTYAINWKAKAHPFLEVQWIKVKSLSFLFPIEVQNIIRGKHGSDTGVYDTEGRFVASKFEEIFKKHSHTNSNSLMSEKQSGLLKANRVPKDYGGWLASWTEWKILYLLCKDKDGLLHKDTVRAVYDGSLFEQMEKEKASTHGKA